jgi:magnesium transporter
MISLYGTKNGSLVRLLPEAAVSDALWIDLLAPEPPEAARLLTLGIDVPTLADMEEIEVSNRLFRDGGTTTMTVVLPGSTPEGLAVAWPVAFLLSSDRLVTVRHHRPRPFETFPDRADKTGTGCAGPAHLFLGLAEEIVARLADHLEGVGRTLDEISREVFADSAARRAAFLQGALANLGSTGEHLGRVRLGLISMERAVVFFAQAKPPPAGPHDLRRFSTSTLRDLEALEVHADFLSARLGNVTDTTLGMVNLAQNATVRILSAVAALFLPPTLIASVYGMNFRVMPELDWDWGYPLALGLMVASAVATYLLMKWKHWL